MDTRTTSRLSVVVTTFLGGEVLRRCLEAVGQGAPGEIIVSVSRPEDVATPQLRRAGVEARVLLPSERLQHAPAANRGIRAARLPFVLALNDDARPMEGSMEALLAAAEVGGPGLYQPRILLGDGSGRVENVGHGIFPDGMNLARGRGRADDGSFDDPGTVGAVSGAAFMAPRATLQALGGFDEDLGAFGEDADLSYRAVRQGLPLRYVPGARFQHDLGSSYGRGTLWKVFMVERNRVRGAIRSLPAPLLGAMPLATVARWIILLMAARRGGGVGAEAPPGSSLAAITGAAAGYAMAWDALMKRRADQASWVAGDRAMWRHILEERVGMEEIAGPRAGPGARL